MAALPVGVLVRFFIRQRGGRNIWNPNVVPHIRASDFGSAALGTGRPSTVSPSPSQPSQGERVGVRGAFPESLPRVDPPLARRCAKNPRSKPPSTTRPERVIIKYSSDKETRQQ